MCFAWNFHMTPCFPAGNIQIVATKPAKISLKPSLAKLETGENIWPR
jgi:hypothetical protein